MIDFISAIIKGFYPYFALPALIVIGYRIYRKRWTRGETFLLAFVLGHTLLQVFQTVAGTHIFYISRRYLLPCAPLLFGWTAWGILALFAWSKKRYGKRGRRILLSACSILAVLLIADSLVPTLKEYLPGKKSVERQVVETVAPVLRSHYHGAARSAPVWDSECYLSPFRPVVVSKYPALGYRSGGAHATPAAKIRYDYWLVEEGERPPANGSEVFFFEISGKQYRVYVPGRQEGRKTL